MQIQYDSTNINSGNYLVSKISHENSPENIITTLQPTRSDGVVVVNQNRNAKYIVLEGIIKGTTRLTLEDNIKAFSELIGRKTKNLDVAYATDVNDSPNEDIIRYECEPVGCEIDRRFFAMTYAPFRATLFVPAGYGYKIDSLIWDNGSTITSNSLTLVKTLVYSHIYQLVHTITLTTIGKAAKLKFSSNKNGNYFEIDITKNNKTDAATFVDTDVITVDERDKSVKLNGTTSIDWRGTMPFDFVKGDSLQYYVNVYGDDYSDAGSFSLTSTDVVKLYKAAGASVGIDPVFAQSFIATDSGYIGKIDLYCKANGSGTGTSYLEFTLLEDLDGKPDTTSSTHRYRISRTDVSSSLGWHSLTLRSGDTKMNVIKGKKYWLLLSDARFGTSDGIYYNTDSSNHFQIARYTGTSYQYGKSIFSANYMDVGYLNAYWKDGLVDGDSASDYKSGNYDIPFKVWIGDGTNTPDWSIGYSSVYYGTYLV